MMGTSFQTRAALSAASAAVLTALTVAVTPTGHADGPPFAAIASTNYGTKVGTSANMPTEDAAISLAKSNCDDPNCNFTFIVESPNCGALGWMLQRGGYERFVVRPTLQDAQNRATGGGAFTVVASICASG